MRIAVINGSPKGADSVTLQYVNYLALKNPGHTFTVIHAAARAQEFETEPGAMRDALAILSDSDAVAWCTPVYYMLVPAQLKRFIELLFENSAGPVLKGRRAFALLTSVHFFDQLAAQYLGEISRDLGLEFFAAHSGEMNDLLQPQGRLAAEDFFRDFLWFSGRSLPVAGPGPCVPCPAREIAAREQAEKPGRRALIMVFDSPQSRAADMARAYAEAAPAACSVQYMEELDIKGGCLGCIHCGWNNECVYQDGFARFFDREVSAADTVVFALPVKDRFFPALFKRYLDRTFFKGHVPVLAGKTLVFLVEGDLNAAPVALEFIYSYAENSGARLCGVVTDRADDIAAGLAAAAAAADYFAGRKTGAPQTYRSAGAEKIFRDMLYNMDFVFHADYLFYKKCGLFRFANQERGAKLVSTVISLLCRFPRFRRAFTAGMVKNMAAQHKSVIEKLRKQRGGGDGI
ncbi:MAG: NAD(P)H-dependent oxidoreductase [Elusimicrobiaceae bacterium]|nr:NAD(P)H-dependent oxidoreductase [Elusimicrobiaceae bacterium]